MTFVLRFPYRILPLLLCLLCSTSYAASGGMRIELTAPTLGDAMFLSVSTSPMRVAGRVVSDTPVVLFMIGSNKVQVQENGAFDYELTLDAGINRVLIMAANASGERAFTEFNVTVEVGAAVRTLEDPYKGQQVPPVSTTPPPASPPQGTGTGPVVVQPEPAVPTAVTEVKVTEQAPSSSAADGTISREELLGTGSQGAKPTSSTHIDRGSGANTSDGRLYALVVGVSRYRYASEQDLHFADKDAEALASLLRERGCNDVAPENIVLLQNGMARADVIRSTLDELLSKASENDRFIFYFSGHGMHDSRGQLCLLGADANVDDPSRAWSTSVTQADLVTALGGARCRNKLLLLDACHSGRVSGGEQVAGGFGNGVTVLTAAGGKESSYESDALQGGIFTHYLLKGLKGAADTDGDGRFNLVQLADYVRAGTTQEASDAGHQQHPQFTAGTAATLSVCRSNGGTAVHSTPVLEGSGTSNGTGTKPEVLRPGMEIITKERTTLDDLLYINNTTGDRLRFYNVGAGWIGISAYIDGDLFACSGRFPGGSTVSFEERDRAKVADGFVQLSANWDRIDVSYKRPDGTLVKKRELWRTDQPASPLPAVGWTYGAPGQNQQLEVWHAEPGWVHLSGHLGRELVILHGRRFGDILVLEDADRTNGGSGTAMFVDQSGQLIGRFRTKEDGQEERFDLPVVASMEGQRYNNFRFDDESKGDFLSFHNENGGWVHFDGRVADRTVKGNARVYGDVLDFKYEGGAQFEPGRMLLHERGDRIMGDFMFPEPELERTLKVAVYLYRSN